MKYPLCSQLSERSNGRTQKITVMTQAMRTWSEIKAVIYPYLFFSHNYRL